MTDLYFEPPKRKRAAYTLVLAFFLAGCVALVLSAQHVGPAAVWQAIVLATSAAAQSNLFSTVIGEKRRGSGSPTTEGSRSVFGCLRPLRLHTHPPLLKGEALCKIMHR